MPHVMSRRNGLRVGIPVDARGVIHRFAIGGGGNELIFEPIKRSQYNSSKKSEGSHTSIGSSTGKKSQEKVETTVQVAEDDEPPKKKPAKQTKKSSGKKEDDVID